MATPSESKWRHSGVRVVHANELDVNTPQTPGMNRAAAVTAARAGAEKLWAGTVVIHPKAKTGAPHHGPVESVIYVVTGSARMRWGDRLEVIAQAGPGAFIYVPPFVPAPVVNAREPGCTADRRSRCTRHPNTCRRSPADRSRSRQWRTQRAASSSCRPREPASRIPVRRISTAFAQHSWRIVCSDEPGEARHAFH